ncbi:hypothetical protein JYU14_01215 [Simkania negevensis]|uniref:NADH:quinone oxidoreductase/Mrp antiporter transmembrane domain-containing protein n=1 Tax=Simkania negevensis TaxID=83561 RepID=A0ABS3APS5_9BACT|nr:hypothetical protein [Simkania negevensis]
MSADTLLVLPFLMALFGSIVSFTSLGRAKWVRALLLILQIFSTFALLWKTLHDGVISTSIGDWLAPYGIVLIADPFAALLLATTSVVFFCCLWDFGTENTFSTPLLFLLQAGINLSFVTGDLFNLFVAFELMLIASYALIVIHGTKNKLDNLFSYLLVNVIASFLYLIAIALFYGYTGTLNLAALALFFQEHSGGVALLPVLGILLVMLIKSGVFPFYFWLPDAYPLLPARLAALFGGTLSKVGMYVIFRLWLTVYPHPESWLSNGLLVLAALTMFLGVMGAVSQSSVKAILCYHVLSQVGYILFAMTLSVSLAVTAGIFFIVHNMVVKSSLLLIGGIAKEHCGSGYLKKMGGLWQSNPLLGSLFLLQALALAGLPPFSGFWAKYLLFFEGVALKAYVTVAVGLVTSFLTLFSMIKIWGGAFQGKGKYPSASVKKSAYYGPIILTLITLSMGILAQYSVGLSQIAANTLLDRDAYIAAGLNVGSKGEKV